MKSTKWAALAVTGALACAGSAQADELIYQDIGVVPPWRVVGLVFFPLENGKSYEIAFAPEATPMFISNQSIAHLDYDNWAEDGQWLGGQGLPGNFEIPWTLVDGVYHAAFTTPVPVNTFWDNGRPKRTEVRSFSLVFDGYFAAEDIGTPYSFTLVSVPEPATWLLMIAGFGLAGAALSRRRNPAYGGL